MFKIGKIPVSFHPLFWVFAGLIGWINSSSLLGSAIWLVVIVVSVLVHELGHALTAVFFGQSARIDFVALGGLTSYSGKKLKLWQQFIIVFNGPLFGFFLFLLAFFILRTQIFTNTILVSSLRIFQVVNLFWSIINLFPVIPLDGGQLLRITFEGIWGVKGIRFAIFAGMLIGGVLSFGFFMLQHFMIGAIFFLFTFQSFDSFRKSKFISNSDRDETLKEKLLQAETALKSNEKAKAKELLENIIGKTQKGMLYATAAQYLAFILFEEGEVKSVYEILLPIKKQLDPEGIGLLHKSAFFVKDYSLVANLSSKCFQVTSTQEVALTNARAFASLKKGKPAGGWLQSAYQINAFDIDKILMENVFKDLKDNKDFLFFINRLKKHSSNK